jgi:hypothetical protein
MSATLPTGYDALPRGQKVELLWERITADPHPAQGMPTKPPSLWARRKIFTVGYNKGSFDHVSDELPEGRKKLVHAHGCCAKVELKVTSEHPYTGVLRSGGVGILRFSDATGGPAFTPSFAIKFPVDGGPSLNFFALPYEKRSPRNLDALAGVFANATPPAERFPATLVAKAFQKTAEALGGRRLYGVYLPLHPLAEQELSGAKVAEAVVPDRLEFRATPAAREAYEAAGGASASDWRVALAGISPGTVLFEVRAAPALEADAAPIGEVHLLSSFVASAYGDERLFFQHHVGPM